MGDKEGVVVTLNGVPMTEEEIKRRGLDISHKQEDRARKKFRERHRSEGPRFPSQCSCGFGGRSRHPKHRTRCY